MKKLKLLMMNFEFPPIGMGAGRAHLSLLEQFSGCQDMAVDVLTSSPTPGFRTEAISENTKVHRVGIHKKHLHFWRRREVIEWLIRARRRYTQLLKEGDYDLIHAFFGFPTGWLCYARSDSRPYIISLRGSDVPRPHPRLKWDYYFVGPVFKAIWRKAAAVVANSQGLRDKALRFYPSLNIQVIQNGVDIDRFSPAGLQHRWRKGETLRLLAVGRLEKIKRMEMLVHAVDILRQRGRHLSLTIVGDGSRARSISRLISSLGLEDIVDMSGRVDAERLPEMYQNHDIMVSASMLEGMSNATLEAMASGLPVVTTRCEGVDELIGENGIVIEIPGADRIADAIARITDQEGLYGHMSLKARERIIKFGWDRIAQAYRNLYEDILNSKPEPNKFAF